MLSDWIRTQIEKEIFRPDEKIPSESKLGEKFGVSRITVRRALQTIEHEGLIYRVQGVGSFVSGDRVHQGLVRLTSFVEDMQLASIEASSSVIHFAEEQVPAGVAPDLELEPDEIVFRLDRLRLGNGDPVAFDRTWLPRRFGSLLSEHDLASETIYSILESHYGIPVVEGRYQITAVVATAELAKLLQIDVGSPLLLIERVSLGEKARPVYIQRRYYRTDKVVFELGLVRSDSGPDRRWPLKQFKPVFRS